MNNEQLVLLLLTLMICFDLVEFWSIWKGYRKASDAFNKLYYDVTAINPNLTEANLLVEDYERRMKHVKLKFMLKMIFKLSIDMLSGMAGIYVIIVDTVITVSSICFVLYKHRRI